MKRTAIILAALMLCAALCACNDDSEKKSGSESTASSKAESSASETESSKSDSSKTEISESGEDSKTASSASSKIKHTLKDYVKQVKKSGLSDNDTMKIDVYAEDNTFVYAFTYKTQIEDDKLQSVKNSLESSFESSSETYLGVVDEIHDYTGIDAEVKVVYKNKDGSVIAERTYNTPEADSQNNNKIVDSEKSSIYDIPELGGSIRVPSNYYVFGEHFTYTDEMCSNIGVEPDNMKAGIPFLEGQTMIVPSDEPYSSSNHMYIKVKEKKYDDITLFDLSNEDYKSIASSVVDSFGVNDYETIEANNLRFFAFSSNLQNSGNTYRYATILSGHMVYVYIQESGNHSITEKEKNDLKSIALSINYNL